MQEYASETAICKGKVQNRKIIADLVYFFAFREYIALGILGNSDDTDQKCQQK